MAKKKVERSREPLPRKPKGGEASRRTDGKRLGTLQRLKAFIEVLRDRPHEHLSVFNIASELGCAERTVWRYLSDLELFGYVFDKDLVGATEREHGFRIDRLQSDPKLPLETLDEAGVREAVVALSVMRRLGLGGNRKLEKATDVIAMAIRPNARGSLTELLDRFRVEVWPQRGCNPKVLDAFAEGVRTNRVLRFRYMRPGHDEAYDVETEPQLLRWIVDRWELIGWTPSVEDPADKFRTYLPSRATRVVVTTEPTTLRPEALKRCMEQMFRTKRDPDGSYDVVIRFEKRLAPFVRDAVYHPSQTVIDRPDGRFDVCFHATILDEVLAWVLSYGADAEAIKPPELRNRIARVLAESQARYTGAARGKSIDAHTSVETKSARRSRGLRSEKG